MSEITIIVAEQPTTCMTASYNVIEEYTPTSPPCSPPQRQRSMTTFTHDSSSHPPAPKRQNSIKKITSKALKSSSTVGLSSTLKEKKSKKSPLSVSSGKEEQVENVNSNGEHNNVGPVCPLPPRPRKSTLLSNFKFKEHSSSGSNSLPLFPTISEIEGEETGNKPTKPKSPRIVLEGPVFKCPLPELLVKESKINRGGFKIFTPYLVENCIVNLLADDVLKMEGIFRQSGRLTDNQTMKALFDKGKYVDVHDYPDPYTIAALLKLYMRELPEPLITFNSYTSLVELGRHIIEGKEAPVEGARDLIRSLPLANKTILKLVFSLLGKAATFESENKMTPTNLAIVIAPNITWSSRPMTTIDVMNDSPAINHITTLLITHHSIIFEDEDTKYVTLDILCQQHNSMPDKFPSFDEMQAEEKLLQNQPPPKKKNIIEKAWSRLM